MTRERAKELAPIISAYGEGKQIQYQYFDDKWGNVNPLMFWRDDITFRIKPAPQTRPMTRDEVLGFLANTQGIVCRLQNDVWVLPGDFKFDYSRKEDYEYAKISPDGIIGEAHKFEKEVEE